jgi:hypothetical protein
MNGEFERFEKALQGAAAAGDVEAAKALASEMRRMMQSQNLELGATPDPVQEGLRKAAAETGRGEAMLSAAGRGTDKLIAGVQQAYLGLPSYPMTEPLTRRSQEALKQQQEQRDLYWSPYQKKYPFATGVGEGAPSMVAATIPSTLGSALLMGGIEAAKYGTPQEREKRGLTTFGTSLAGGILGNAAARAVNPIDETLTATQRGALSAMENVGVSPRLSQVTNSPFWARVEDWAARTPGGAGVMQRFDRANRMAQNRAAAGGMGEVANELTPEVFAAANKRIGQVFDDIRALPGRPIQVNQNVSTVADDILRQQRKMLPTQQDTQLIDLANQARALAANRGRIDGETYQLVRSGLSSSSFDATGANKVMYGRLLEALDDSADASLRASGNTALANSLKTARPEWANLKTLETGAVSEGGNVSPARLASVMRSQNPAAFREGRMAGNPLYDVAQIGESMKPLQAGSPTYERTLMSNPLSTTLGAITSYPAAQLTTHPAALAYPLLAARNPRTFQALGEAARPAVKGGSMMVLNTAFGPVLFPAMPE